MFILLKTERGWHRYTIIHWAKRSLLHVNKVDMIVHLRAESSQTRRASVNRDSKFGTFVPHPPSSNKVNKIIHMHEACYQNYKRTRDRPVWLPCCLNSEGWMNSFLGSFGICGEINL